MVGRLGELRAEVAADMQRALGPVVFQLAYLADQTYVVEVVDNQVDKRRQVKHVERLPPHQRGLQGISSP